MSTVGLPNYYRLQLFNETGQQLAVNACQVTFRRVKYDSNGALDFATENTPYDFASTLNDDLFAEGPDQDNSGVSDKWLGADVTVEIDFPASTDGGPATIKLQKSTDGGTTWPDDGEGEIIATIASVASTTVIVPGKDL